MAGDTSNIRVCDQTSEDKSHGNVDTLSRRSCQEINCKLCQHQGEKNDSILQIVTTQDGDDTQI